MAVRPAHLPRSPPAWLRAAPLPPRGGEEERSAALALLVPAQGRRCPPASYAAASHAATSYAAASYAAASHAARHEEGWAEVWQLLGRWLAGNGAPPSACYTPYHAAPPHQASCTASPRHTRYQATTPTTSTAGMTCTRHLPRARSPAYSSAAYPTTPRWAVGSPCEGCLPMRRAASASSRVRMSWCLATRG